MSSLGCPSTNFCTLFPAPYANHLNNQGQFSSHPCVSPRRIVGHVPTSQVLPLLPRQMLLSLQSLRQGVGRGMAGKVQHSCSQRNGIVENERNDAQFMMNICAQFMMDSTTPSVGVVTFKGHHCIVSLPDARVSIFCLIENNPCEGLAQLVECLAHGPEVTVHRPPPCLRSSGTSCALIKR